MASKAFQTCTGINVKHLTNSVKLTSSFRCSSRTLSHLNVHNKLSSETSVKLLSRKNFQNLIRQSRFLQAKIQNNIVESPFGKVELEEKSLGEILISCLQKYPTDVCLVCSETGRSLTCQDIYDMSRKFGSCLVRRGFKVGDTLCISSSNSPEYLVAILGAIAVGGKIATASPTYTVDELSRQLQETRPKFLICEQSTYAVCAKAAQNCNIQVCILVRSR